MPDIFSLLTLGVAIGSLVLNIIMVGKVGSAESNTKTIMQQLHKVVAKLGA